jgi:hypothetical protein
MHGATIKITMVQFNGRIFRIMKVYAIHDSKDKVKLNLSLYRPWKALRTPGSSGSQNF